MCLVSRSLFSDIRRNLCEKKLVGQLNLTVLDPLTNLGIYGPIVACIGLIILLGLFSDIKQTENLNMT